MARAPRSIEADRARLQRARARVGAGRERVQRFALNLRYAFRPRKPRLVARLARAVLQSAAGRPPLRYVDFAIDYGCNLRCEHCFAAALERPGRPRMTPRDYARVAQQCMALGTVNFSFQGGEPLLAPALGEIIAACRPAENLISVTTNGVLLTDARLDDLVRWGVDVLTVSLDSGIAHEHDRFRGAPGAFHKTLAGVQGALARGLRVTLGAVVTHQTLRGEGIARLIDLARRLRVILYLIMPVPAGRWAANREMLLTADDLAHVEALTRSTPYVRTDLQANLGGHGCGAAKEILYLTPYGDVLACPFLHVTFGNVLEEPIRAIRERALAIPQLASYWPRCLVSTDEAFVRDHLSKTLAADELPVPWEQVFD